MAQGDARFELWKSFADLGLGMAGAMAIAITLVLALGAYTYQEVLRIEREKLALEKKLRKFEKDKELLKQLRASAKKIVERQDAADCVLALLLQGDCQLEVDETGGLRRERKDGGASGQGFYATGRVEVTAGTSAALRSCRNNFARLADCLTPPTPGAVCATDDDCGSSELTCAGPDAERRCRFRSRVAGAGVCRAPTAASSDGERQLLQERHDRCNDFLKKQLVLHSAKLPARCAARLGDSETLVQAVDALSSGVEAVVLEGNADALPYGSADPVYANHSRAVLPLTQSKAADSFARNAYLGAERARQALGHLLFQLRGADSDQCDALPVMMNKLRVESGSFGRFQAGPITARQTSADGVGLACAATQDWVAGAGMECDAARSLRLQIRWSPSALREPYVRLHKGLEDFFRKTRSAP